MNAFKKVYWRKQRKTLKAIIFIEENARFWWEIKGAFEKCGISCDDTKLEEATFSYKGKTWTVDKSRKILSSKITEPPLRQLLGVMKDIAGTEITDVDQFLNKIGIV